MKLYALKCRDGYLKVSADAYSCVELAKASVFPEEKYSALAEYLNAAGRLGFPDVRITELLVTENEDFLDFPQK
ncbi:MAG TPA: hypothetical protein VN374_06665 [Desulfitobacteriaceae bacterium]|nr:hypothetical protein [Desulfitobacteriaceae bacterium]